ncbi:hypothetical protein TPHA_0I01190 [Tetrapisispora phaffii CBS 4417]|uniref:F-box domain-containing protein n=1 Tax=Tetrapisispora phaffii (strain ATCC 24235 / CBS 4417 / NBRC 1672 / NRRL Y-8282 / UCD 70-5) TaxID=1071381 RepID=G8BXJ7_TETPH|nr:hypothetical protein TPHA_0I01190 [Tetrapisispora phaffii CBS 4417]CCE64625.1 hypothetical protein TPHA_0I01190 [Tetrapisispora phaffii CBS 4417]
MSINHEENEDNSLLNPDIIQAALPFLSPTDLKNLSLTNKYFNKLLNYSSSDTLWHELYHKVYNTRYTDDEPFQTALTNEYRNYPSMIMAGKFTDCSWHDIFKLRSKNTHMYTWGCLKHGRLGYDVGSNPKLTEDQLNQSGFRVKSGVNQPVMVPWITINEDNSNLNDFSVAEVSGGGFSFQILTKSGKLFSTGSTFSGGYNGPGPINDEIDYNPFRSLIENLENSLPRIRIGGRMDINTTGVMGGRAMRNFGPTPASNVPQPTVIPGQPHSDIYSGLMELEKTTNTTLDGNSNIRRMFPRNVFDFYTDTSNKVTRVNEKKMESVRFVAVSSGRSHFLALDENNKLYSWDTKDLDHGVQLGFKDIDLNEHPIIKISCGWNFSCAYIYNIGLVVWKAREALKKGQLISNVDYEIIPNTSDNCAENKILDFTCLKDNRVLFITNKGDKLFDYFNGEITSSPVHLDNNIIKISSCFSSLVLFTTAQCFKIDIRGSILDFDNIMPIQLDDTDDTIVSLASGDFHSLALTQKGNLYSWGLESQLSGCLGLGLPDSIVQEERVGIYENNGRNIRVLNPSKIKLEDDCVAIAVAAGGWQSSALIVKK